MPSPLHPRNRFRVPYDFDALPSMSPFVRPSPSGRPTIDFADPEAVRALNRSLLEHAYAISGWNFPTSHLTPAVPGRLDLLHHVADLLAGDNGGRLPNTVNALDVGTGASAIYALLGAAEWGWRFLASDTDPTSLEAAAAILRANPALPIALRQQPDPASCFHGVLGPGEVLDLTVCNPPFYASAATAAAASARKASRLGTPAARSNFSGQANELHCPGGEHAFLHRMAKESTAWGQRVRWFTSLVAASDHVPGLQRALQKLGATRVEVLPMATGNKQSRVLAWTFLTPEQERQWRRYRWA